MIGLELAFFTLELFDIPLQGQGKEKNWDSGEEPGAPDYSRFSNYHPQILLNQQGLITPVAVVVDVDALLALGIGRDVGAVGVEESLLEELVGLLSPDAEATAVDDVHQGLDVGWCEATAEITLGGGVGNSLGAQGVEIDLVVAPQFKVFDPLATSEDVEGDVQDMVGFVVGQMTFEKAEVLVDIVDQADLLSQQENGADPAGTEAFDAIGVFVMDIRGGHHGFGSLGAGFIR
jgi:hypothetical protein